MSRKASTPTPTTPETPAETIVDAIVTPVPTANPADEAKALKAYHAVWSAESKSAKAVALTMRDSLPTTVQAWHDFGQALRPIVDASEGFAWESVASTSFFKAWQAGKIVSATTAAKLPNQHQSFGKAFTLAKHHQPERLSAFLKAGNDPDSNEYVIWLNLLADGKPGSNRSTIDLVATFGEANVDTTGDKPVVKAGSVPRKIVRGTTPGGRGGSSLPNLPTAVAKVLKVRDSAAKMLDAAPSVVTLNVKDENWDAFVAQVLREYLTRKLSVAPASDETVTITA